MTDSRQFLNQFFSRVELEIVIFISENLYRMYRNAQIFDNNSAIILDCLLSSFKTSLPACSKTSRAEHYSVRLTIRLYWLNTTQNLQSKTWCQTSHPILRQVKCQKKVLGLRIKQVHLPIYRRCTWRHKQVSVRWERCG